MKRLTGIILTIFSVVASLAGAPALAQETGGEPADYGVTCADHRADWQSALVAYEEDNKRVEGHTVDIPPGTHTIIFTCPVGGHLVRMNFAFMPTPHYQCGATADARISVWVDGAKVVDNREWGTFENCMNAQTTAGVQLARILVNDKLNLTVCERLFDSGRDKPYSDPELKPGQKNEAYQKGDGTTTYYLQTCTLTHVTPGDDTSVPRRTPPGLEVAFDKSPVCRLVTPDLVYLPDAEGNDPSLSGARVASVAAAVTKADAGEPHDNSFSLDVDNDGIADMLTLTEPAGRDADAAPYQYAWRSGASGKTYPVTGTLLKEGYIFPPGTLSDPVFSTLGFLSLGGRTYLYVTMVGTEDALPMPLAFQEKWQGMWGPGFDQPTRRIFELHPDGTASELCGWTPRQRPEEYL